MRQQYYELRDQNEHLLQQIERDRHELDSLELKKVQLEEELQASPFKQEAGVFLKCAAPKKKGRSVDRS